MACAAAAARSVVDEKDLPSEDAPLALAVAPMPFNVFSFIELVLDNGEDGAPILGPRIFDLSDGYMLTAELDGDRSTSVTEEEDIFLVESSFLPPLVVEGESSRSGGVIDLGLLG